MSAAAAAVLALLLGAPVRALDPRLAAPPEPEPGSFPGLTLSLGSGRPVCGRVTFDRRKAAAGGLIFATDAGEPGDEDAIRLSEAVIARRGGLVSRAAISARRHGVPAVALGRGEWDAAGPSLTLREPVFEPAASVGGLAVRAAGAERDVVLREGSAACVDAAAGRVLVPSEGESEARVAAAEAARAYDGLRDEPALERWIEAEPGPARAEALTRELAPRALDGTIPSADLARLQLTVRASAGTSGRESLAKAERRAWSRALRAARGQLADCAATAADASASDVLDRLTGEAKAAADRAAAAGKVFGGGDGGFGALARACLAAANKRRRSVPPSSPSLEDAAAAAGAARAEASPLRAEAWKLFVAENGLGEFLSSTLDDASLGLRRKSERVRARILEGRLDEATDSGRWVVTAASSCPCLVVGEDATVPAKDAREALTAVREAWAASWGPGPLGARLRAGRAAVYDGTIRFAQAPKADVSGLLFSRDPGSGRRRVLVEAAPGGVSELLTGGASADRYALEPRSGRALEAVAAAADGKLILSPERLKRLARLARGLDAWRGGAIEAAFSFNGDRLQVTSSRPLEAPRPLQPLSDPFSPRPAPEALSVKPVR